MEFDKCTVLFHGKPLMFWSYSVLRTLAEDVLFSISTDRDEGPLREFLGDEVRFVRDKRAGLGPLFGMSLSFKEAKGEYVAVAPCDAPFIRPELYLRLFQLAEGADAAVPEVNGYWEPLHAVYERRAMLKAIEKAISEGGTRPKDTYGYLDIAKLTQEEIKTVDPELLSFVNINTIQNLENASSLSPPDR
jgi:molybdopterin-guanine dinucleotide biosynthesis protein A